MVLTNFNITADISFKYSSRMLQYEHVSSHVLPGLVTCCDWSVPYQEQHLQVNVELRLGKNASTLGVLDGNKEIQMHTETNSNINICFRQFFLCSLQRLLPKVTTLFCKPEFQIFLCIKINKGQDQQNVNFYQNVS